MSRKKDYWPIAVLLVLPLLWHADIVFTDARYFLVDIMEQYFPWWQFARTQLTAGHLPLWNPYALGGVPFHLNPQAALFYPLNVPLFFLLDFPDAMVVLRVAHALVASLGMYALLRRLGAAQLSAMLGSVMFGYGSFMSYEIVYPTYINTMAWFPWQLLLLHRIAHRSGPVDCVLLALVTVTSFFGGMPQAFLMTHLALGAFFLFMMLDLAANREWRRVGAAFAQLLPAVLLTVGLSAALLLPVAKFMTFTARTTPGFYNRSIVEFSGIIAAYKALFYPFHHLQLGAPYPPVQHIYFVELPYIGMLAVPFVLAHLVSTRYRWIMPALVAVVCFATLMSRGAYSALFADACRSFAPFRWFRWPYDYLHMIYPALAIAAATGFDILWRDPRRYALRFMVVVVIYLVAGFLWIRDTLSCLVLAAGALLAALTWLRTRHGMPAHSHWQARWAVGLLVCALFAADLYWYGIRYRRYVPREVFRLSHYEPIARFMKERAPFSRSSVAAFDMMYILGKERVFFDYFSILDDKPPEVHPWKSARDWLRGIRAEDVAPEMWSREAANQYPNLRESAWDACYGFPSHAGMLFEHCDIGGYDTFMIERVQTLYQSVPIEKIWNLMNVRHVATPNRILLDQIRPVFSNRTAVIYENTSAFPRAMLPDTVRDDMSPDEILLQFRAGDFDPRRTVMLESHAPDTSPATPDIAPTIGTDSAHILVSEPNRVLVQVARAQPGPLVLHDVYHPDWKAIVDGHETEVLRANYAFRACFLPAGKHLVEFRYEPVLSCVALAVSLVFWTACISWLAWKWLPGRRRKA